MLEMSKYTNTSVVADNEVVINGVSFGKVTNNVAEQIISLINGTKSSTTIHFAQENTPKKAEQKIVGKVLFEDDFTTVTDNSDGEAKDFRLYIHCPIGGEKGKSIRYAIKANAKDKYGVKFLGDYDNGDIFWAFPNKAKANAFIKDRKDYAKANAK